MNKRVLFSVVSLAALHAHAAAAQSAGSPSASQRAPDVETTQGGVEEIVVTAQKRAENLQSVPISITAVTEKRLDRVNVTSVADLNAVAPGLNVVSAQGFIKPYIRGVGTQAAVAGIEMPVAIYQDGVYLASAPSAIFAFNDIRRVEVLKGPQGTLFGRNATGGLINIITRDPADQFELDARASIGNHAYHEGNLFVGGPLGDAVRASATLRYADQRDGWGTNQANGDDAYEVDHDFSARAKLFVDLGPATRVKITGDYTDRNSSMNSLRYFGTKAALSNTVLTSKWNINSDYPYVNHFKGGGGLLRIEQEIGDLELLSMTAYRKSRFLYGLDLDLSQVAALSAMPIQRDHQFSQEVHLQSPTGGAFEWIVGLFFFDAKASLKHQTFFQGPLSPLPTSNALRVLESDSTTRSIAGFAQASLELGPRTKATAGLRYTSEKRGFDATATFTRNNGTSTATPFGQPDLKYKKATWRLSLDHKLDDAVLMFASYNRGFKSGGFNPTLPGDPAYLPETIDAFEGGLKTQLANRRVRFNTSGFFYKYRNIQVARFVNGVIGIYNGAKAEIYGAEAELDIVVSDNLDLNAGIELLHAKFTDFPLGVRGVPLASGGYRQDVNQDLTGNRTPNAPRASITAAADWHMDTSFGAVGANVNYYYNDGFATEADNVLRQPAYHLVNASLRWTSTDERFSLKLWGKNLLSEGVTTQLVVTTLGAAGGYQAPATYGATIGVHF